MQNDCSWTDQYYKTCLCHTWTTKVQISLCHCHLMLYDTVSIFEIPRLLLAGWFESYLVAHLRRQHDKTNKMTCAPSKDSDQPGHPPSLIRVFAVRMKKHWVLSYPLSGCPGWVFSGRTGHFVVSCCGSNDVNLPNWVQGSCLCLAVWFGRLSYRVVYTAGHYYGWETVYTE